MGNVTRDIRMMHLSTPGPLTGIASSNWPVVGLTLSDSVSAPAITVHGDRTFVWYIREESTQDKGLVYMLVQSEIQPSEGNRYEVVSTDVADEISRDRAVRKMEVMAPPDGSRCHGRQYILIPVPISELIPQKKYLDADAVYQIDPLYA